MSPSLALAMRLPGWDAPNKEIEARLVALRHQATTLPLLLTNGLVAAIVAAALWNMKSHPLLLAWVCGITAVALLIAWNMHYYRRAGQSHSPLHWALRFMAGAFINGTAWGLGALLFFDTAAPMANILMVGVICGMTAATVMTSFAIPGSAYAFLLPAILLSMGMPLIHGSSTEFALALLWLPYLAILVTLTRSAHKGLAESIRLHHENEQLAKNLAVARDQAERLARIKADFLAIMSHEIRTPMHGMLGVAELLSATGLAPQQKLYVDHLRAAGDYLAQLINNILDFSKFEAEKVVLSNAPFSLSALNNELTALFSPEVAKRGITLLAHAEEDLAPYYLGDVYRLKQVLINLIGNAVKFTAQGVVSLSITSPRIEANTTFVEFRVQDSGMGIPSHQLDTIFEPFVQADSMLQQHGGTGLGLAISQRLVRAMGGELRVESHPGRGSLFFFTLPLNPVQLPQQGNTTSKKYGDMPELPPFRVLLVDDSPLNRLVVREFLKECTGNLDEAESGEEAVQKYRQGKYDIVLIDMRMPGMDGVEAVRQIRAEESRRQTSPAYIIMLTATVFERERFAVLEAGCNELLTKPIPKEALLQLLRKYAHATSATQTHTSPHIGVNPTHTDTHHS